MSEKDQNLMAAAKAAEIKGDVVEGCFIRKEYAVADPRAWWEPRKHPHEAIELAAKLCMDIQIHQISVVVLCGPHKRTVECLGTIESKVSAIYEAIFLVAVAIGKAMP